MGGMLQILVDMSEREIYAKPYARFGVDAWNDVECQTSLRCLIHTLTQIFICVLSIPILNNWLFCVASDCALLLYLRHVVRDKQRPSWGL